MIQSYKRGKKTKKGKNGARIKFQKILIIGGSYELKKKVQKFFQKKKYKKVKKSEKNFFVKKEKYFRRRTKNIFVGERKILRSLKTEIENGINGKKGEKPGEKKRATK